MTSASVPVDAEVKVTLNQSAVPEGMVFDLWAMDEASLLGNPAVAYNEESFTIPADSVAKGSTVTVEAQYRDATIESEPSILGTAAIIGVAGAGTGLPGGSGGKRVGAAPCGRPQSLPPTGGKVAFAEQMTDEGAEGRTIHHPRGHPHQSRFARQLSQRESS